MFRWTGLTIDCQDPARLARFWAALLDRDVTTEMGSDEGWATIGSRTDPLPRLNFQQVPEQKALKVRIHLDLSVDDIDRAISEVKRLGGSWTGTRLEYDEGVVVHVADPEGNEFCLVQYY
jgi:predicted enzyme related to lactoylglutathione lyase